MYIRRLYYTLFEILIVISVLALVAGLVSINIRKALHEQNFRSEVELVVNKLRVAQDLMLIFRGEVKVLIKKDENDKGLIWLEFESKMPGHWEREAKRIHTLKYIRTINFRDELLYANSYSVKKEDDDTLEIRFLSNGSTMSKGLMQLASGDISRYIYLPGYPAPIISLVSETEAFAIAKDDSAFNHELTSRTAAEVQFLKEKKQDADSTVNGGRKK